MKLSLNYIQLNKVAWQLSDQQITALTSQFKYYQIGTHNSQKNGTPFFHLRRLTRTQPREVFTKKFLKYLLSISKNKVLSLLN